LKDVSVTDSRVEESRVARPTDPTIPYPTTTTGRHDRPTDRPTLPVVVYTYQHNP